MSFDGETFDSERDSDRLQRQLAAVRRAVNDGRWWTLSELALAAGAPEASVSARLRDLRKPKFGHHIIEREYAGGGLWRYRMVAGGFTCGRCGSVLPREDYASDELGGICNTCAGALDLLDFMRFR